MRPAAECEIIITKSDAADPLEVYQRDGFMTALTLLLKNGDEISNGELFQMLRELQREHYDFRS